MPGVKAVWPQSWVFLHPVVRLQQNRTRKNASTRRFTGIPSCTPVLSKIALGPLHRIRLRFTLPITERTEDGRGWTKGTGKFIPWGKPSWLAFPFVVQARDLSFDCQRVHFREASVSRGIASTKALSHKHIATEGARPPPPCWASFLWEILVDFHNWALVFLFLGFWLLRFKFTNQGWACETPGFHPPPQWKQKLSNPTHGWSHCVPPPPTPHPPCILGCKQQTFFFWVS